MTKSINATKLYQRLLPHFNVGDVVTMTYNGYNICIARSSTDEIRLTIINCDLGWWENYTLCNNPFRKMVVTPSPVRFCLKRLLKRCP